jgi:hypothetical protein
MSKPWPLPLAPVLWAYGVEILKPQAKNYFNAVGPQSHTTLVSFTGRQLMSASYIAITGVFELEIDGPCWRRRKLVSKKIKP